MTQEQFDNLYTKVYSAYEDSMLKDEYVRSTLGDALDHLIELRRHTMSTNTILNSGSLSNYWY